MRPSRSLFAKSQWLKSTLMPLLRWWNTWKHKAWEQKSLQMPEAEVKGKLRCNGIWDHGFGEQKRKHQSLNSKIYRLESHPQAIYFLSIVQFLH